MKWILAIVFGTLFAVPVDACMCSRSAHCFRSRERSRTVIRERSRSRCAPVVLQIQCQSPRVIERTIPVVPPIQQKKVEIRQIPVFVQQEFVPVIQERVQFQSFGCFGGFASGMSFGPSFQTFGSFGPSFQTFGPSFQTFGGFSRGRSVYRERHRGFGFGP